MLDSLTRNNAEDFRARYEGTYGFLKKTPESPAKLVHIQGVNRRTVSFVTCEGQEGYVNADSGINFEFLPITRGWYELEDRAVFLTRVPARQWQRGISNKNTSAKTFDQSGSLTQEPLGLEMLEKIFVTKPQSNLKGFIGKKIQHYVLSKFVVLRDNKVYFLGNHQAGTYTIMNGKVKIKLNDDLILQEMSDTVRRQGLEPFMEVE